MVVLLSLATLMVPVTSAADASILVSAGDEVAARCSAGERAIVCTAAGVHAAAPTCGFEQGGPVGDLGTHCAAALRLASQVVGTGGSAAMEAAAAAGVCAPGSCAEKLPNPATGETLAVVEGTCSGSPGGGGACSIIVVVVIGPVVIIIVF